MPSSLFFPLDSIQPSQILSQYSEWIYFALILVFFISISGIALRRHFDKPYVKPLIIAVGLMLTFGVFRFKGQLMTVLEGWGILGTILIVFIASVIPYGLCRGFGLPKGKAFYLTYILFYILSWIQFPQLYYTLGDRNLGVVNLGLLILLIVAVFKLVKFGKSRPGSGKGLANKEPFRPEIEHEIDQEEHERKVIKTEAKKLTKLEIHTVEDIVQSLAGIQRIIEKDRDSLSKDERERIAHILETILGKEAVLNKGIENVRQLFHQIEIHDVKQLQELQKRMAKAEGKERQILKAEIKKEEEKLKIENIIVKFEERLSQCVISFAECLVLSVESIKRSPYPYDAKQSLTKARTILRDISDILKETKMLEKRVIKLTKLEKRLLKKERENV